MFAIEHCGACVGESVELIKLNKSCKNVVVVNIEKIDDRKKASRLRSREALF
jgi:hypothetical protein